MTRNLENNSTSVALLGAQRASTTALQTGSSVDTKGEAQHVLVLASVNLTNADSSTVVTIEDSDDNSTFATLHAFDKIETTAIQALVKDLSPRRYVRATVKSESASAVDFSVYGVFYGERYRPSNVS